MNQTPPKSDIEILLGELNSLLVRLTQNGQTSPTLELEILKIKSELVRLFNERDMWAIESTDRVAMHKFDTESRNSIHSRELDYQFKSWKWQAKAESRRTYNDWKVKMLSEAIGFGKITINSLIIVSAGAVLAILAFLGNILKSDCTLRDIDFLMLFVGAVAFAIAAAALAYICQIIYLEVKAPRNLMWGNRLRYVCIVMAIASFICFGGGAIETKRAFSAGTVFKCEKQESQKIEIQSIPDIKIRSLKSK